VRRLVLAVGGVMLGVALGRYFSGDDRFLYALGGFGLGFLTASLVVVYDLGKRRVG